MAGKKIGNILGQLVDTNPIESFREIGGGLSSALTDDLLKASGTDMWNQMFGNAEKKAHNEQNDSGEIILSDRNLQKKKEAPKNAESPRKLEVAAGNDYHREIVRGESRIGSEESREIAIKVEEIIIELKQLINQSQELQVQFKQVASEQRVVKAGKYHLSFFEFVLTHIRRARMKVESSAAWLSATKGKKGKKAPSYQDMAKKMGTSFTLSNERTVATQTG